MQNIDRLEERVGLVGSMKGKVIFVNRTPPSSEWDGIIDFHIEGDTDAWTDRVLEDWKKIVSRRLRLPVDAYREQRI